VFDQVVDIMKNTEKNKEEVYNIFKIMDDGKKSNFEKYLRNLMKAVK
jgi:hypothetical protein